MKIAILAAMEMEMNHLVKAFDLHIIDNRLGRLCYHGTYNNHELTIVQVGVGKVNAACTTQWVLDQFSPELVVNTGIAGGLKAHHKPLMTVIATDVTHHDVDPLLFDSLFGIPSFSCSSQLIKGLTEACDQEGISYDTGRIVSGEAFICSDEERNRIIKDFDPHAVEMEGSAIGHVCHLNKIPFVVMRTLSDCANDDASEVFEEFEYLAADKSQRIMLSWVKSLK